ncbi:MAG: NAD(P)/FAD-dependent oxidoreductase [Kordiimonadaceae bacterium]|nr:NAD(P)/FAD-dependent oxidoreductase [Kordiimonadaceae bacterium]
MYDVAIIGGGHNGLVCAFYLARAGLKTVVLEARDIVGGAAVTEEFHPGYRNSSASYTVSLLNPQVISDMGLYRHGLKIVERKMSNFFPLGGTGYLSFPVGNEQKRAEFAKFSKADSENLDRFESDLEAVADQLRAHLLKCPPNAGGGIADLLKAAVLGLGVIKQPLEVQRLMLDMAALSVADFLDRYFESDVIKAAFAFDGIVGAYTSPYAPGTAYVLLHHAFGEVNGKKGVWGHAIGGMGAITQAMASAAVEAGVEIRTGSAVARVLTAGSGSKAKAVGVLLKDGSTVSARAVSANVAPKLLFAEMVDSALVPADFATRVKNLQSGSGTFRMNVALRELPNFTCLPSKVEALHHSSGIVIGPSVDYLDEAYSDARKYGWSRRPVIEMLIPSTLDDTLCPEGHHVASLFCQQFSPHLKNGATWDDHREAAADLIIQTITEYAPNFEASIIARQIHSPLDLERKFGLIDGDIFHGQLTMNQLFSARPVLGYADYKMPLKNLYLCGSGAHPGGGVTGAPGHNAAKKIISDL